MKLSELISALQAKLDDVGDLDVLVVPDGEQWTHQVATYVSISLLQQTEQLSKNEVVARYVTRDNNPTHISVGLA